MSSGPTESVGSIKPPALKDETTQPPVKKVKIEEKSPEIAKSPPTLTASVVVNNNTKQKDEEIKEFATTDDDDDDNDSDYPSGRIKIYFHN